MRQTIITCAFCESRIVVSQSSNTQFSIPVHHDPAYTLAAYSFYNQGGESIFEIDICSKCFESLKTKII